MTTFFSRAGAVTYMHRTKSLAFAIFLLSLVTAHRSAAAPGDLLLTIPHPDATSDMHQYPDYFGRAIASLGDTFIVSRHLDDEGAPESGSVYQFDSATGALVRKILNPSPLQGDAFGFALTANETHFAVAHRTDGGGIKQVDVFDGRTGSLAYSVPLQAWLPQVLTSVDEKLIVKTDSNTLTAIDFQSGDVLTSFIAPQPSSYFGHVVLERQQELVVADYNDVLVFDRATGALLSTIPPPVPDRLIGLAVDPVGNLIAKYSGLPGVHRFDGETHEELPPFPDVLGSSLYSIGGALVVPDSTYANGTGIVRVYDVQTGKLLKSIDNPTGQNDEYFGNAIAAVGVNILVGAIRGDVITTPERDAGVVYLFEGVPILQPGDTDADGDVDLEDLNNVRNNFGGTGLGDTNADGVVDLDDLNNVRNHFGEATPNGAVPEPGGLVLGMIAMCLCAGWRIRARGHA